METKELVNTKTAWLGEVPSHWEIKRLGGLFEERNEIVSENDYAPLSVTMKGIVPQLESAAKTMHVDNRKKVCVGDFAINSRSDRRGSGGLSYYEGSVSIVNTVLKPSKFYVPEFTHYLLTNKLFQDEYYAKGKGIVADMWSTRFSEMKTIYLPVPPKDEQDEIVQYIKAQEEKINLFIQKKQRFIELLKEQRQIVIHQVVTKGLNQKVKLKSSGIEWLGDIPTHWEIRRLKECLIGKLKYGANESGEEYNPTWYRYIRITDFSLDGKLSEENKLSLSPEIGAEYALQDGDILFARSGATVGKTFQFHYVSEEEKYCYAGYLIKATPDKNIILSDFLFNYTNSKAFENWKNSIFNKATIENIGADKYSVLKIPIPPIEEQKQIVEHIKTETATIDTAIAKAEREIELIREYKEAMIAEAVMGKRNINFAH